MKDILAFFMREKKCDQKCHQFKCTDCFEIFGLEELETHSFIRNNMHASSKIISIGTIVHLLAKKQITLHCLLHKVYGNCLAIVLGSVDVGF